MNFRKRNCGCTLDADLPIPAVAAAMTAGKRRIKKVWFAPGAPAGVAESDFWARVMNALAQISSFTLTDFVRIPTPAGAFIRYYVADNEMMWKKKNSRPVTYLGLQGGNWVYFTANPRWGTPADRFVEGCAIHETFHRFGIGHSQDITSIMHPWLPVMDPSPADIITAQARLGKP